MNIHLLRSESLSERGHLIGRLSIRVVVTFQPLEYLLKAYVMFANVHFHNSMAHFHYRYYQGHIELPKAARGHATSYYSARTCIDGIVLSVTKSNISVKHVKFRARFGYGRSTENIPWARKMSATDVGTETPSKRSLAQVLLLVRVALLPV